MPKQTRKADRTGMQAYDQLKSFSLVPQKKIAAWKSYSLITFFAGLVAATAWLVSYRIDQDTVVINTLPLSKAKSDVAKSESKATDQILVKFKKTIPAERLNGLADKYVMKEKGEIKQIGTKIFKAPNTQAAEAIVKRFKTEDGDAVEYVEVDQLVSPVLFVSDPSVGSAWQITKIQADTAWDTAQGEGVIIGIADTGVDCTHPDLSANCVAGWNTASNSADTTDVHGHGTMTAGTAAEVGNNALGAAGIAYKAKIMPLRVTDSPDGWATWSAIASATTYAADHGVRVVSNSYGAWTSSTVQSAAAYLRTKNGVFVGAAMNEGLDLTATYSSPASITVTSATDSNDTKASWSNYGAPIDVAAPGVAVYCTIRGGGYGYCSGTSFSTPVTAGTYALMFSANPSLTPAQADNVLFSTVDDLGASGKDPYYGFGRVNASKAVAQAAAATGLADKTPPSVPQNPTSSAVSATQVNLTWTASTDNVGVSGYTVYRNGSKLGTSTTTSYADYTTVANTLYSYTVSAYDESGNASTQSVATSVTTPTAPFSISAVTIPTKTATTAIIGWEANEPSTGVVKYGTSASSLSNTVADATTRVSHQVNLSGLTKKTRYYFQITATTADGKTTTSALQSFVTRAR